MELKITYFVFEIFIYIYIFIINEWKKRRRDYSCVSSNSSSIGWSQKSRGNGKKDKGVFMINDILIYR